MLSMKYAIVILVGLLSLVSCDVDKEESSSKSDLATDLSVAELMQRAEQYVRVGEYERAISDYTAVLQVDSLRPEVYHSLADARMDYYKSRAALETMLDAAERFPTDLHTQIKLSEYQYILKQYDESLKTIDNILTIDPEYAEAYFMYGMIYMEQGNADAAIKSFQRATEIDSDHADSWMMLGNLYSDQKNDLALQCYDNVVSINPESVEALHNKAFYFQNTDRIAQAKQLYREINEQNPQYTDAYFNTGILYLEQDSLEQALQHFEIATKTDPQYAMGYYYKGVTYEKMGDPRTALAMYRQALQFRPDFVRAQEAADYLESKI